jgi:hypothetical protein
MTARNGNTAIRRRQDRPGHDPRLARAARALLAALAASNQWALARAKRGLRGALRAGEY